jgi:hypothetical protein
MAIFPNTALTAWHEFAASCDSKKIFFTSLLADFLKNYAKRFHGRDFCPTQKLIANARGPGGAYGIDA